jgi:hypothetical protein
MLRGLRPWLALMALVLLAGCAGAPAIPYDRATAGAIKTIGVVTPVFPDQPRIVLASTIGRSFGLIGALIDAGLEDNRNKSFATMMGGQNFAPREAFLQQLTKALQEQGYGVVFLPVVRDSRKFLETYPPSPPDHPVDAYLDLVVGAYGYLAAGIQSTAPYRPVFYVAARLVRAGDKTVLMRDAVVYNPLNPNGSLVTISPDPAYSFVDFDTLMADPPKTVAGLDGAATQSAVAIATLLH